MLAETRSQIILMLAHIPFCALFPPTSCPYGIALHVKAPIVPICPGRKMWEETIANFLWIPSQAKGEPMLLTVLTWLPLRPRQTTRPPLMIIPRLSLLPHRQKKTIPHISCSASKKLVRDSAAFYSTRPRVPAHRRTSRQQINMFLAQPGRDLETQADKYD
jgi:hypothetical protein